MKRTISVLVLGFTLFATAAEMEAGQQVAEGNTQLEEAHLKERVNLFYQDLLKNNRMAALELVAPDSKNQFLNNRYDGLMDFRIVGITVEQSGDRAAARVVRVMRLANFGQPLDLEINDTWQRSSGQWYLVLPPPGELDTPFGKMKFDAESKPSDAEIDAMKHRIQQRYQNVDPDQYIRALQKVVNKPAAADANPTDKQQSQPPPAPAATTKSEKPKQQP
jgi:hypothetical protein